jgi:molybdopterin molybdotransferase
MPEFLSLLSPEFALARWLQALPADRALPFEEIPTEAALGRVLAQDVRAPEALPSFPRASVDGYAVRAADTFGASASLPSYLSLVGEVPMGTSPAFALAAGQAALVHTGGMLPSGADAVVMLEDTQPAAPAEIEVLRSASVGSNVIQRGEDLEPGDLALPGGLLLRPQEIGGLLALGILRLDVVQRPRVALLATGDEVIPPSRSPALGEIRDINSLMLASLVSSAGGEPSPLGILPDSRSALEEALRRAIPNHDLVIITAGSSASTRDLTSEAFAGLGQPGVLVHGLAIKPGKPTILAVAQATPLIGLPGNPVSALIVAHALVVPMIRHLLGLPPARTTPRLRARLTASIPSEAGRTDYQPVRWELREGEVFAEPVFGKSNLIFTLVRAGGVVRVPPEVTGLSAGSVVDVMLFDSWQGTGSDA